MAIGNSLQARENAYAFMQTALKQLGLDSIHLYIFDGIQAEHESLNSYLSIPDNMFTIQNKLAIYKLLLFFKNDKGKVCQSLVLEDTKVLAYDFASIGVLILGKKHEGFHELIQNSLLPVINKLAKHFDFCQRQQQLNRDVQDNKNVQRSYELQAKRDPLTNLPNRRAFRYSLSKEITSSQHYDHYSALMYVDLDNFKNVNDSLGHSIGDILLSYVAKRLTAQSRACDTVFRIGGDEFVYILSNVGNNKTDAMTTSQTIAARIIDTLGKPIEIGAFSLHITPSIGIALFPDASNDGNDSENILQHADTAMYQAKKRGRNCFVFFKPEMHIEVNKRLIIENHLRKAILSDELHIEYQPIVNADGKIIAAESLIRWDNKLLGKIVPDDFISIAEDSNLILDLSNWVIERVCAFAEELYQHLDKNSAFSYVSINISPRQFVQSNFVEEITATIDSCAVPNNFIKLEFTESVLLDDIESTIVKMEELHVNNINFLLDDFGTGYSSLSYLHRLPIWLLKIDKSFVSDFYSRINSTQTIVNAILLMAEELGIKCIIEGVENQEQANFFKKKAVYGMQGFFFHKPMSGVRLNSLLCENKKQIRHQDNLRTANSHW